MGSIPTLATFFENLLFAARLLQPAPAMSSFSSRPPFFLNWNQPWIPQLATFLLDRFQETADLSDIILVLPGRRAGRRLLELLALQAQEKGQLFFPPTIMTLEEAIASLFEIPEKFPVAGKGIARLAWREAARRLTPGQQRDIQSAPESVIFADSSDISFSIAALAEGVADELGKVGLSIEEVLRHHTPFFPESADREEPRWQALANVQKEYHKILSRWCYADRWEVLKKKLAEGHCSTSRQIFVAGVVDMPALFISFFQKTNPNLVIIAPEAHAAGFDAYGRMIPSYWLQHPAAVPDDILIPCDRSQDQAAQAWNLITHWKKKAPHEPITLVAPEAEAVSSLREAGAAIGFQTRWAGGHFFQGSSLFILLKALKKFSERPTNPSPSLSAVADLLRHPLIAAKWKTSLNRLLSKLAVDDEEQEVAAHSRGVYKEILNEASTDTTQLFASTVEFRKKPLISSELLLRELDDWERDHLAQFLEEAHLKQFHKEATLGVLLQEFEKRFCFALTPEPLEKVLREWRTLLLYLLEEENIRRSDAEGHFFLECFEKLISLTEELEALAASTELRWRSSELFAFFLEILSKEPIPELEQPEATEIIGWLEAPAEDTPALILVSFHEGAVPSSFKNDPLLSRHLRNKLNLGTDEHQLARDHYYLQLILASRKKEGSIAILAPRYNGRGEPVRPSRLLLQGCSHQALPARVLKLTQRQKNRRPSATHEGGHDSLFVARPLEPCLIERLNVTALRTYLRSPRLFYLQHILKLREVLEAPVEMTPSQFGVLLHQVLARFSAEPSLREEKKEAVFLNWLESSLEWTFQRQFGKNPSPAVTSQQEELWRALKGFAQAEAAHREQGWKTIAAEGNKGSSFLLEEKIRLHDGRSLVLQGRIDRIDWHPETQRWLILDYKTSHHQEWKKETPNHKHFQRRGENITWHDLQLPLYLKLATHWEPIKNSGLPLPHLENSDLCYFQLPIHPEATCISEPFDTTMVEPAWQEAERLVELILNGQFEEIGEINPALSPTWAALCGVV